MVKILLLNLFALSDLFKESRIVGGEAFTLNGHKFNILNRCHPRVFLSGIPPTQ